MRRFAALVTLLLAGSTLLPAGEFDWMVREFARQSGAHQTHIPFLGLARFIVAVGHPAGTSELHLAIFEHPGFYADNFSRLADTTVGTAWKPIVRVRSHDGDATNIYAQANGKHLRLLVATLDRDEAVFVEVRIRPDELTRFIDDQKRHHHA